MALAPALAALTRQINGNLLLIGSLFLYFAAYLFRFNYPIVFGVPVADWIWEQTVLFGISQLGYFAGMVCRKYGLIGMARRYLQTRMVLRRAAVVRLPAVAFIGHCIIQSAFVAPFTAVAALTALFLTDHPRWAERSFLVLGKHSTNIWLVHMFFFHNLFKDLVFFAKYPILTLALMLGVCFAVSAVNDWIYRPVLAYLDRRIHTNGG